CRKSEKHLWFTLMFKIYIFIMNCIRTEQHLRQSLISLFFLPYIGLALMDKFECQFETLDVQTAQMEDTMGNSTTLTTPQVLQPIASVIILLDLNMELPQGQTGAVGTSVASAEQVNFSAWRLTDQSHAL
uniref:Uncharacterized protein n=1 Tax=Pygocentrus nattereri TaxID=42514 RepID=A0AAR2LHT6_PYGNA